LCNIYCSEVKRREERREIREREEEEEKGRGKMEK